MVVVEWVIAIALFWLISALFLGGAPVSLDGGSPLRESAALLVSFGGFLALWYALKALLGGAMGGGPAFIAATAIAGLLLPVLSVVVLRVFGIRVRRTEPAH